MRQNCLPHLVNFAMSSSTKKVETAMYVHQRAIHTRDFQSSPPQSSVGMNMSGFIPARYLDSLQRAFREALTPGRKRVEAPLAVADQFEVTAVELLNGAAMTHADQNRLGEFGPDQFVEHQLQAFVHRGGGLVEEDRPRLAQQNACEGDPLLLADRQHLRPVPDVVEPDGQVPQGDLHQG